MRDVKLPPVVGDPRLDDALPGEGLGPDTMIDWLIQDGVVKLREEVCQGRGITELLQIVINDPFRVQVNPSDSREHLSTHGNTVTRWIWRQTTRKMPRLLRRLSLARGKQELIWRMRELTNPCFQRKFHSFESLHQINVTLAVGTSAKKNIPNIIPVAIQFNLLSLMFSYTIFQLIMPDVASAVGVVNHTKRTRRIPNIAKTIYVVINLIGFITVDIYIYPICVESVP